MCGRSTLCSPTVPVNLVPTIQLRARQRREAYISLRQRELNPYRLLAPYFGAFYLVVLALRQQGRVRRSKNPSKSVSQQVQSSFCGAVFCSGETKPAANTDVFARDLTKHGRKTVRKNRHGFDSRCLNHKLRDLHGVCGGAFSHLVAAAPDVEAVVVN